MGTLFCLLFQGEAGGILGTGQDLSGVQGANTVPKVPELCQGVPAVCPAVREAGEGKALPVVSLGKWAGLEPIPAAPTCVTEGLRASREGDVSPGD